MPSDARIATGLPAHPKTKKLIRRLGPGAAWHLVCLFLWAVSNRSDGDLSGMTDEDIEIAVDWAGEPGAFVAALVEVRFLDGEEVARSIHDWADHNPYAASSEDRAQSSAWAALCRRYGREGAAARMPEYANRMRVAESRSDESCGSHAGRMRVAEKRSADSCDPSAPLPSPSPLPVPSPVPVPSPEQQHSAASQPLAAAVATAGRAEPAGLAAGFDEFWKLYPRKEAKPEARKAWSSRRIGTKPELVARILEDVRTRTARHRPWLDGFTPHPATYIRGERWEDAIDDREAKGSAAAPAERAPVTHNALETQRRLLAESDAKAKAAWEAKQAARAGGAP